MTAHPVRPQHDGHGRVRRQPISARQSDDHTHHPPLPVAFLQHTSHSQEIAETSHGGDAQHSTSATGECEQRPSPSTSTSRRWLAVSDVDEASERVAGEGCVDPWSKATVMTELPTARDDARRAIKSVIGRQGATRSCHSSIGKGWAIRMNTWASLFLSIRRVGSI
mmetsp:Transcript_740/g.1577  ORF Transcript_740/g.1577 Transcript_740/m.1577 type:complete len:166 (-) Transcript_740:276-773(-)